MYFAMESLGFPVLNSVGADRRCLSLVRDANVTFVLLQVFKEEHHATLIDDGISRLTFIHDYEVYCLKHFLEPKNVVENMDVLESYGLYGDLVVGNATEVSSFPAD